MSLFILDLFFAMVFVLIFIFLLRIKDRAFVNNRESLRYTMSGIFFLFLTSVFRLLEHQGLFAAIPFLSENIYRDLTEAIGIVTGIALMISGVSIWLPQKKKREKDNEKYVRRSTAVRHIESEILEVVDVNRLFTYVPELICKTFGFKCAALFRLNHKIQQFVCTNLYNPNPEISGSLKTAKFDAGSSDRLITEMENKFGADLPLQVRINNRPKVLIFFWYDESCDLNADDRILLEKITQMFSFRLQSQFIDYRQVFYAECQQYLVKMNRLAACRKDLRSNLHDFHLLFGQATGAEYLSLAVLDRYRKNMRRFTIGRDGKILLENGSTLPVENTQIDNVIESCRSMIIDDVTLVSDGDVDSLFKSCGLRSLAALPIVNDGRVICTITLGHPAVGHFNRRHLVLAETLAAGMAPAVEAEIARRVTFERDRYLGAIASFDLTVQKCTNLKDIYDAAADLLLENIGTTIVRISTLNRKNSTLVTRAIRTIRPFDDINLEPHGVSRHLTRWHQMVIEENRPLLINQSDPESSMDDVEARALVFKGMQSALIVPISVNGLIYGLITLGEMRVWERFSYQPSTIVFCREIAARIANGIKMLMFSRALLKSDKNRVRPVSERAVDAVEGHFMQDLKSQVTTIRGSLDLLKLKGMDQSEKTDRIISTMDKSANRIITLMNEERETVPS